MDELGIFERRGDESDLRFERFYAHPIETVWAALTDPARLEDWLGQARVEPRLGGRYDLFVEQPRPMRGRILAFEPPRLLEYLWDTGDGPASLVRCELTKDGDGARLLFTHKGIGFVWIGLALPGWHANLERLAALLAGAPKPMSMPRWRELQKVYLSHYRLEGVMIDPPTQGAD